MAPKLWHQQSPPPSAIGAIILTFLTMKESEEVYRQLRHSWLPNRQVLWSGVQYGTAQRWASKHGMQTLTAAMGPLMDSENPRCHKKEKTPNAWSKYVHGASAVFAWYIAGGDLVTVLSRPPPQRFHPSGQTYYQVIEEPIIKGDVGNRHVNRINVAHPNATEAVDHIYEMWPDDQCLDWKSRFGDQPTTAQWRSTGIIRLNEHPGIQNVHAEI
ncbi:hypothetical protein PT974_12480 [Cladobotryum mycophilum]|uniref:Uncharacterized protein n=1 Tax=Cladobotryum mycophilum TaxID=491253 RepID=A0ABR0S846_9HYPO